jgi:hypothetical protein
MLEIEFIHHMLDWYTYYWDDDEMYYFYLKKFFRCMWE